MTGRIRRPEAGAEIRAVEHIACLTGTPPGQLSALADTEVLAIDPLSEPSEATVSLPGSKSITNRAFVCAALATGSTRIEGALFADDTETMAEAVTVLGAEVTADPVASSFTVRGVGGPPQPAPRAEIDARMSGTTGRFLVPVAATASVPVTIDGHPQLRARPFGGAVEAISCLGAVVDVGRGGSSLPITVRGPIGSGPAVISVDLSSQFLSGLMLAGPVIPGGLSLRFDGVPVSRPYVEMTAAVMRSFGAEVELSSRSVQVGGGGYRSPGCYRVEPDASAASYFWAAAAVTGGSVGVTGLTDDSIQGDVAFASVLEAMGASVSRGVDGGIVVTGGPLRGADVELGDLSDTAPTLAVVAALASGPTRVRGIGFIRGKESDRIAATVAELRRCGVNAVEQPDGFTVSREPETGPITPAVVPAEPETGPITPAVVPAEPAPVAPEPGPGITGALIHTYDDHRMAMAFSVLGLVVPGVKIENPRCVAKTFPGFFDKLEELRIPAHESH